jgi:nitronate monooxygenase
MNKWRTSFTDLLQIRYPIVQGPFGGGYSSVKLASVVSNLGGMGSFGAHHLTDTEIIAINKEMKSLTKNPFAINLWIPNERLDKPFDENAFEKLKLIFKPYFDEFGIPLPAFPVQPPDGHYSKQVEAILKSAPPVFSFVFGIPDADVMKALKKSGIKTLGTATTVDEAIALQDAGVDMIAATGFEAGGHRVSFIESAESSLTGTFALIPQVADHIKIPILAAGGIADGRGIAAAFALGAQGVQVGSAFLACEESNAPDLHKGKLLSKDSNKTVLTKTFSGRLARGTSSILSEETRKFTDDFAPYPLQGIFIRPLRAAAIAQKRDDMISFWAGQSASLIKYRDASDLFHSLVKETEQYWQGFHI